jgi:hypothetical protein
VGGSRTLIDDCMVLHISQGSYVVGRDAGAADAGIGIDTCLLEAMVRMG